jgi:hypothetical protein
MAAALLGTGFRIGIRTMNNDNISIEDKYAFVEDWAKAESGIGREVEPEYTYGLGEALAGIGYALSERTGRPEDMRSFIRQISQITGERPHSEEVADIIKKVLASSTAGMKTPPAAGSEITKGPTQTRRR